MMDDLQVQQMSSEDLAAVLAIEQGSFEDPWTEDIFNAELRHSWSHCDLLRTADGMILGYIVFWSVADEVHLLNVAVDPNQRKHQYGRRLLDHMLEFARTASARFITLEVRSSNEAALQLYENGGFKRVGVRPRYYANDGEDAVIMLFDLGSQSGQISVSPTSDR
jgi:[ribosomal protein S18]-alanine N-acetyltransferase